MTSPQAINADINRLMLQLLLAEASSDGEKVQKLMDVATALCEHVDEMTMAGACFTARCVSGADGRIH